MISSKKAISPPLASILDSSNNYLTNRSIYVDDNYIKLQIWDTAGQERFRGITKSYYKGASAVIITYDITNPSTFNDLNTFWIKETKQYSPEDRIYCFINKCDQGEDTPIPKEHLLFMA